MLTAAMFIGSLAVSDVSAQNKPGHIHDVRTVVDQVENVQQTEENRFMQYDDAANLVLKNTINLKKDVIEKAKRGEIKELERDLRTLQDQFHTMSYNLSQIEREYENRGKKAPEALTMLLQDVQQVLEEVKQMSSAVHSVPSGLSYTDTSLTYSGRGSTQSIAEHKATIKMRAYTDILNLDVSVQEKEVTEENGKTIVTIHFTVEDKN